MGVVRGQLRFRCFTNDTKHPSISLLFRNNAIWRIDVDGPEKLARNPPWAESLGLPATITGVHMHGWPDHREYMANPDVPWGNLPCRRPILDPIRTLIQALPWFADCVNLEIDPLQRGFDVPPQSDLFSR